MSTRRRAKVDGARVAAARAAKGLTQRDLADLLKVTSTTVSRWETSSVDFIAWVGMLTLLGLPLDWQPPQPQS